MSQCFAREVVCCIGDEGGMWRGEVCAVQSSEDMRLDDVTMDFGDGWGWWIRGIHKMIGWLWCIGMSKIVGIGYFYRNLGMGTLIEDIVFF